MTDEELEAVLDEVWRHRADIVPVDGDTGGSFVITVLGGKWTFGEKGVAVDNVCARARGAYAQKFCTDRGMFKTARWDIDLYDMPMAYGMARAWIHIMQSFFEKAVIAGDNQVKFSAADIAAYEEPAELQRVAIALGKSKQAQKRVQEIRRLFV